MKNSRRFLKKRSVKAGMPPGSLVHIGETPAEAVSIELIGYAPEISGMGAILYSVHGVMNEQQRP